MRKSAMRVTIVPLLLAISLACTAYAKGVSAQEILDKRVSLTVNNLEVKRILHRLQELTSVKFVYSPQMIAADRRMSLSAKDETLGSLLDKITIPLHIRYKVVDDHVLLYQDAPDPAPSTGPPPVVQPVSVPASDREVTGTVTNQKGEPLSGVSILLHGTTRGVTTNDQGRFRLNVPDQGEVLLDISFVGYQSRSVNVGDQTSVTVVLKEEATGLNDVVVVGYGTQRKKDLTGAISVIKAGDVANLPVGGVDQIMQGKAAGVAVTAQTGAPGDAIAVRVRGVGTINNNNPLYIIDGIPTTNGINEISPADIESINILKDASSAAIYGARASNGVVIITTRQGKTGKARLSFNAYTGVQTRGHLIKMADTRQYVDAFNTAAAADGRTPIPAGMLDTLPDVNWQKEILRPAAISNIQASVSGGSDNTQYIVSADHYRQDGLIMNSNFERFNVRTAVTSTLSKWFKVGTNVNLSYARTMQVGTSGDGYGSGNPGASVVRYALFRTPATPVYNKAGQYVDLPNPPDYFGDGLNPVGLAANTHDQTNGYSALGDAFVELRPVKNLTLRSDLGGNFIITANKQFFPTWGIDRFFNSPNSLSQSSATELNYNWTNTGTYHVTLADRHTLDVVIGSEAIKDDVQQLSASRTTYVNQTSTFQYLDNGLNNQLNGGNEAHWALFSLFGRVGYQYQDKYLASFSYRRDGSSRLSPGNQYGSFYSGSLGWRIDKEGFMAHVKDVSLLKLRASIGELGNQEIGNYPYVSLVGGGYYYPFGGTPSQGYSISSEGNANIRWETSTQSDLGLDLGLWDDALTVTADYFVKNTANMLLSVPIPTSAGNVGSPTENAGKVRNNGLELEATYHGRGGRKFHYDITGNFATLHNEVISLAGETPIAGGRIDNNYYATMTAVGHPIGAFYLLQDDGIFQTPLEVFTHAYQGPGIQPGDVKFKDISGPGGKPDGVIDDNDRTYVGSPIPKITYGLTGTAYYGDFDLTLFFQGVYGNQLYNQVNTDIEGFYRAFNITERVATESWHGEGTSNTFPRLSWDGATNNKMPSTRFLESGSYLRLKNVQLGYRLPKWLLDRLRIPSGKVYVSAQNLVTFTKYTGMDPEMYISNNGLGDGVRAVGIDWGTYPTARTYTIGINLNF